jgi:hypothetical protein
MRHRMTCGAAHVRCMYIDGVLPVGTCDGEEELEAGCCRL